MKGRISQLEVSVPVIRKEIIVLGGKTAVKIKVDGHCLSRSVIPLSALPDEQLEAIIAGRVIGGRTSLRAVICFRVVSRKGKMTPSKSYRKLVVIVIQELQ